VWKSIHGVAPAYLQELRTPVESVQGRPRLQSASTGCVELPRVCLSVGQRSFTFYGPTVWNSLSSALHDGSLSLNMFGRHLKSHLFKQSSTSPDAIVASCDSGAAYKCHNLLTYITTPQQSGKAFVNHNFSECHEPLRRSNNTNSRNKKAGKYVNIIHRTDSKKSAHVVWSLEPETRM